MTDPDSPALARPAFLDLGLAPSRISPALAGLSSRLQGYLPALAALVLAVSLHALSIKIISNPAQFLFFGYLLAFLIAAWCGYGPGLLVTLLILFGVPALFRPNFSPSQVDLGRVATSVLLGFVISGTATGLRRTERLLRGVNDELDNRVRQQTVTLQYRLAELETLYGKLPVGLGFLDTELRFIRVNEKLAAIHGSTVEAHVGQSLREMVNEDLAGVLEPLYTRVLQTQDPVFDYEVQGPEPATGDRRVWALSCAPVASESRVLGLQVVVQDITERKQAERELNQANEGLRRANQDLEQFAYTASHDLQEPLRTVAIYSQLLQRRFENVLGSEGSQYVRFTVQGARRMEHLVKDLLAYTQASITHSAPAPLISANSALDQALLNLQEAISESQASVSAGDLPELAIHRVYQVQLFQNLIGNAIKYRGKDPLQISVSAARQQDSWWQIEVQDNGIGIDPQYQDQVFGIFKRLHRAEDYPGTGIGLAICRRIVEQHGGKIWVESELGKGAKFCVMLKG